MARSSNRRRGRGSLYRYKTKSGDRWRWQIYEPTEPGNPESPIQRTSKGGYRTADEADEGLRAARLRLKEQSRARSPRGVTVSSHGRKWLEGLDLAPATVAGYKRLFRLYLEPRLGNTPLESVSPTLLKSHYAWLRKQGGRDRSELSANTVRKAHVVLGAILDSAVDDGLIAANVARRTRIVKPPTGRQVRAAAPEMITWTAEQVNAFMNWDRDVYQDEHHPFWFILSRTGMRRSEALALRWSDIDMKGRRISVRRAADTIHHGTVKSTKSGKARVVDVDTETIDTLKSWKALRGTLSLNLARPEAYVFGDDSGNVINPNRATARWSVRLRAARKALGEDALPEMPMHGLRHTHATLLLAEGIHPKVVQERLGHSDISITMSVYSHVTETMQRDAAERLAAVFARR